MMTVQAEKVTAKIADKAAGKAMEKHADKPAEKRRALGRGLESLLPGPRVVAEARGVPDPTQSQSVRTGGAPDAVADLESGTAELGGAPIPITIPELHAAAATPRRASDGSAGAPIQEIALGQIDHNPYQTRSAFDEEFLEELADSIRTQGVIQPVVVRPAKDGRYILILGERRLRASRLAGKTTIPVVVRRVSEQQAAEMTLVENLQRQDLNCMDQAAAFRNLSENFKLTQEEIGKRVGVSRETVSNYMRLLRLPGMTSVYLQNGDLTYSHARELLVIEDDETLEKMAERAVKEKLSVDRLEELITDMQFNAHVPDEYAGMKKPRGARWVDPNVRAQQRSLETVLGMKIRIRDRKGKGTIRIEYGSLDDFDRLVALLKGKKQ